MGQARHSAMAGGRACCVRNQSLQKLENGREIVVGKFEVVLCTLSEGAVELDSLTEVVGNLSFVVGAGSYNGLEIVGNSGGVLHCVESSLSLAVVLSEDLSEGGVIGLSVAE